MSAEREWARNTEQFSNQTCLAFGLSTINFQFSIQLYWTCGFREWLSPLTWGTTGSLETCSHQGNHTEAPAPYFSFISLLLIQFLFLIRGRQRSPRLTAIIENFDDRVFTASMRLYGDWRWVHEPSKTIRYYSAADVVVLLCLWQFHGIPQCPITELSLTRKTSSFYANKNKPALVFTILKVFICHHKKCTQTGNPVVAIYQDNQALFKVPHFEQGI